MRKDNISARNTEDHDAGDVHDGSVNFSVTDAVSHSEHRTSSDGNYIYKKSDFSM